jgi:hypothetical protein
MNEKLKVIITGPTAKGKTTLAALLTWAMRKFNRLPNYTGDDRQKWMQLAGDEMELSQTFAALCNKDVLPMVEIVESNSDFVSAVEFNAVVAERDELKAQVADLKKALDELAMEPIAPPSEEPQANMILPGEVAHHDPGDGTH